MLDRNDANTDKGYIEKLTMMRMLESLTSLKVIGHGYEMFLLGKTGWVLGAKRSFRIY